MAEALVIIGMPQGHWCKTSEDLMVVRIPMVNEAIARARQRGWMVIFGANRVEAWEAGDKPYPRGRRVPDIEPYVLPVESITLPHWETGGGCVCTLGEDEEPCTPHNEPLVHFHSDLDIRPTDYCVGSMSAMVTLIRRHGLLRLYYGGAHTDMCVLTAPGGMAWIRYFVACSFIPEISISHRLDEEETNRKVSELIPMVHLEDVLP